MPRRLLSFAMIFLSLSLWSQGIGTYLPERLVPKASKLLATIDRLTAAIEARRASLRASQLRAESDAVVCYALIEASAGDQGPWAKPDGSASAKDAPGAYALARAGAKAAILALVTGREDKASTPVSGDLSALLAAREEASDSLAALISGSGIREKTAAGLATWLAAKSKALARTFPDAADIEGMLLKAGAGGARAAAGFLAYRGPSSIARALSRAGSRILKLAPGAENSLSRLESAIAVYDAWLAAAPSAAYPGDLDPGSPQSRAQLAAGLEAVAGMTAGRASAFFSALAGGDALDAAAATAAQSLARLWQSSPQVERESLAIICGTSISTLALFSASFPSGLEGSADPFSPAKPAKNPDALSMLASINAIEAAMAEQEVLSGTVGEGATRPASASPANQPPEPVLQFLERPELAAALRGEPRYAGFIAEVSLRLSNLYSQAAQSAALKLESSPSLAKAASLALGRAASSISVRSFDLGAPLDSMRRVAFFAIATDSSGGSVSIPVPADQAGAAYSEAFARAAGLWPSVPKAVKADPRTLLAKYRQLIVSAYDPEGSMETLTLDTFPRMEGMSKVSDLELEHALIGGWVP